MLAAVFIGLALVVGAGWVLTSDTFQLWYLERRPLDELERTVRKQPNAPWPAYVLGSRYAERDRLEEAMDLFERSRNLLPNDYRPHFSMGLGFLRLGAPSAAVPELEQAAALAPKNGRVITYLGSAMRQANRYRNAVTAGELAVKLLPRDAEAWYQLGLTYYQPSGKQGQGRECFKRAVELDPGNPAYRRDYAASFSDVGEYAEAEQQARVAVRLSPNDAVARYLLGKILHRSQPGSPETVTVLRQAVQLSPNTFQPHYELGLVLEESGDYAGALKEFQISSRINGKHQQSWFHQANAATRVGKAAEAAAARSQFQALTRDRDERQFLERRVFDHPNDATLRLKLAALLERNDELVAAATQCQAILQKNPQHAQARAVLARLAKKAGVSDSGQPKKP